MNDCPNLLKSENWYNHQFAPLLINVRMKCILNAVTSCMQNSRTIRTEVNSLVCVRKQLILAVSKCLRVCPFEPCVKFGKIAVLEGHWSPGLVLVNA